MGLPLSKQTNHLGLHSVPSPLLPPEFPLLGLLHLPVQPSGVLERGVQFVHHAGLGEQGRTLRTADCLGSGFSPERFDGGNLRGVKKVLSFRMSMDPVGDQGFVLRSLFLLAERFHPFFEQTLPFSSLDPLLHLLGRMHH